MVMDVIAAANARQATLPPGAPKIIRMEVGQPGTGAPAGARGRGTRRRYAGGRTALGYTEALGPPIAPASAHRAALRPGLVRPATPTRPCASRSPSAPPAAFPLAFLAAFEPGDRVAMAAPVLPALPATS